MTTKEKQIRKAHLKAKSKSIGMKKAWRDIRKDHKIDRHNAILDLVSSGIDINEARGIIDKQIRNDEAMFRFEAYNEISRKKKALQAKLKLGE